MENQLPGQESTAKDAPVFFPFPFPPYDIQEDFMQTLYHVLENGEVGIFESPTGTGKSLSLICGALTWLKNFEERRQEELEKALLCAKQTTNQRDSVSTLEEKGKSKDSSSTPDWVMEFSEKQAKQETEDRIKEERERLEKQKERLQKLKNEIRPAFAVKSGKRKHSDEKSSTSHNDEEMEQKIANEIDEVLGKTSPEDPDANIVLTEYLSDGEDHGETGSDQEEKEKDEEPHCLKIFYCSRTHSQLAQFVREVQKSPFNDSTRVVSLGSRQNLCINEDVKSLKSISKINDRCLELQKKDKDKKKPNGENAPKKKKLAKGCPFYTYQQLQKFRNHVLVDIKDIEQLVSVGEELHACPYYGTRLAIPPAQLVVLPYNILLHKSTREACGIKLEGNVVIIDEAHNLIDTISSVHSVEITASQISCAHSQLTQYQDRYRTRLKAKNLLYIQQLLYVLTCFLNCLGGKEQNLSKKTSSPTAEECSIKEARMQDVKLKTINDFLFSAQMDNVNLFKIKKYCEKSMISKKLNGFIDKYHSVQVGAGAEEDTLYQSSPLQVIENFLEALTNADKDGRVVVNKQDRHSSSSLKFLLLNPAVHFTSVVREARAVIVAGGTMQPMSDFKDQLFTCAGLPSENILEFSCGHVIPAENLLSVALDKGPSGKELDFTYQSRDSPQLKEELGRLLINIFAVVPGGVVCFFSSYDYEEKVYKHWETTGILDKMNARKKVFREPRKNNQLDQVLSSYAACIKRPAVTASNTSPNGAVLLCVVGGKMSEGINFSDDLGRCVVMVGLPYPNIYSPELKEKMTYLDATLGPKAGQTHYENLCMKAVNQSIGRAIRHRGDYATILLLDQRYGSAKIRKSLPGWISNRLQHQTRFGSAFAAIRKFFVDKRRTDDVTEQGAQLNT
ncbi:DEAD H (Asp-Glu-Ala-Asp His) box helicase 11 [Desmophyllum pertusum]|uniref:DEAD H (Asp-Glu-Ala-Asp His) box helicase 11 n=1 Tax=Desmophyllum pertusum TaxID=174260 RepID=A0A9W9Y8B3_9CNID|nr:DEAD H (Asp-Glu-Ala-Asp His) box helicase 11 [Desmophyllum pertusum]